MPTERTSGACASLAMTCARPDSTSRMPVERDATAEAAVERRGRHLDDGAGVDERPQPLRIGLDVRVPLRVRDHDAEPAQLEREDEVGQAERPADVGELEQEQRRVAAEAEPAQRLVVELAGEGEVELAAAGAPRPRMPSARAAAFTSSTSRSMSSGEVG